MIKIIKNGTRQVKECEDCGCVFSFDEEDTVFSCDESDLKKIYYSSHPKGYKRIIRCPQCETVITLEATR